MSRLHSIARLRTIQQSGGIIVRIAVSVLQRGFEPLRATTERRTDAAVSCAAAT